MRFLAVDEQGERDAQTVRSSSFGAQSSGVGEAVACQVEHAFAIMPCVCGCRICSPTLRSCSFRIRWSSATQRQEDADWHTCSETQVLCPQHLGRELQLPIMAEPGA